MNEIVKHIKEDYQRFREQCNYNFIDIGNKLEKLAEMGLIWVIKDLKNISDYEKINIDWYLNKYKGNQIYDNLYDHFDLASLKEIFTTSTFKSSSKIPTIQPPIKNVLKIRDVKKFVGYQKASELEKQIIEICNSFPNFEKNHVIDQIMRSAESIKKGIVQGEQAYIGEKFYQYSIAIGSAKETFAWLEISKGQNYITESRFLDLNNTVTEIVKILTGNLVNIKRKKGQGMDLPSPYTPDVKNFDAYKQALLLVEKVYELTRKKEFWNERHLQNDMRKSATSSVANIAEAHQLYIPLKFRFFNDALQALNGLDSLLDTSLSKGIVSKKNLKDIKQLRVSIRNILSKRMANIRRKRVS